MHHSFFFTISLALFMVGNLFNASNYLQAQHFQYGFKGGATYGALAGKVDLENSSAKFSLATNAGIFTQTRLHEKWGMQFSLLYNQTGVEYSQFIPQQDTLYYLTPIVYFEAPYTTHVSGTYRLKYLEAAIVPQYYLWPRFSVFLGPRFSVLLKGKHTGTTIVDIGEQSGLQTEYASEEDYLNAIFLRTEENFDEAATINPIDVGLNFGTQLALIPHLLFMDFSLNGGFINVQQATDDINVKLYNVDTRLGLSLNIGSFFVRSKRKE